MGDFLPLLFITHPFLFLSELQMGVIPLLLLGIPYQEGCFSKRLGMWLICQLAGMCADDKGSSSQSHGFSSGRVWVWELDHKQSWALKNWCFWTVVLEKTLESSLDSKEIKPVHPKGNQSWIFIEKNDAEAETPIIWAPDAKSWLIGKDPDAGKDWRQEEKRTTEGQMVGWHHWLSGHDFEQTPEDGDGQGSLARCSPWGRKELNKTEQLNNNKNHCKWLVITALICAAEPAVSTTTAFVPSVGMSTQWKSNDILVWSWQWKC